MPLQREVIQVLDGEWRFATDRENEGERIGWPQSGVEGRLTATPAAWQFIHDDLRDYRGPVWYERDFTVSPEYRQRRLSVVFSGVDHYATVWVNGKLAGSHEGGYLPFSVDVSDLVTSDARNRITVRAIVPEDQLELPGDETGQGHRAGIWRPVWMEATGATFVADIHVIPDIDASETLVAVELTSPPLQHERQMNLTLELRSPDGRVSTTDVPVVLQPRDRSFSVTTHRVVAIEDQQLWTLENPVLYRLTAELRQDQHAMDTASVDFGMRKIDIDGIHLRLNGTPLYLMGAMDAQDIPDKNIYLHPYHAPTDEEIRKEIVLAKEMDFNCIRKHHQIEDHRYLRWADRLGLLVYGQPPCYRRITDAAIERWRWMLEGWVRRDRNSPAMIMWTLFNAAQG